MDGNRIFKVGHDELAAAEERVRSRQQKGETAEVGGTTVPNNTKAEKTATVCVQILNLLKNSGLSVPESFIALGALVGNMAYNMSKPGHEMTVVENVAGLAKDYVEKHQGTPKIAL